MLIKFILSDENETEVLRRLEDGQTPDDLQIEVEDKYDCPATIVDPTKEDALWFGKYLPKAEVRQLMYDTFADENKGSVRRWLNERWVELPPRECPKDDCKTSATVEEIDEHFGYRKIGGRPFPQSYCRGCRSTHRRPKGEEADDE